MAENASAPTAAALISKLTVAEDTKRLGTFAPIPATAAPLLQLFNSMTRKKEPFVPHVEGKVSMYVCRVTPYDFSHARTYVAFDVLYRYRSSGPIQCPIAA